MPMMHRVGSIKLEADCAKETNKRSSFGKRCRQGFPSSRLCFASSNPFYTTSNSYYRTVINRNHLNEISDAIYSVLQCNSHCRANSTKPTTSHLLFQAVDCLSRPQVSPVLFPCLSSPLSGVLISFVELVPICVQGQKTLASKMASTSLATVPKPFVLERIRDIHLDEVTIPQLQAYYSSGRLTSAEYTAYCLGRIRRTDPYLEAVIETNPDALSIATELDQERRDGKVRGPLHGTPVLVKDVRQHQSARLVSLIGAEHRHCRQDADYGRFLGSPRVSRTS